MGLSQTDLEIEDIMAQKSWIHEYQIVGRKKPSELQPEPPIFRMRIFAKDSVKAKSRFWYFLSKYHKMKKQPVKFLVLTKSSKTNLKNLKILLSGQDMTVEVVPTIYIKNFVILLVLELSNNSILIWLDVIE